MTIMVAGSVLKSSTDNEMGASKWNDISVVKRGTFGDNVNSMDAADYIGPYGGEENSFLFRQIRSAGDRIAWPYRPSRGGGFGIPYGYIVGRIH
ncbi:hypothetical protein Tcan_04362 [Toxocara canis]|uniref:Uncharacterized protein n=1 Tax=Toxocara canis TaxID=6265 RepID=A0A0B2VFA7_TOXCA|nr:hypothetical protein Tcan_04362 [Toxocara canis]